MRSNLAFTRKVKSSNVCLKPGIEKIEQVCLLGVFLAFYNYICNRLFSFFFFFFLFN